MTAAVGLSFAVSHALRYNYIHIILCASAAKKLVVVVSACEVAQAASYSVQCLVATCNPGWHVSGDNAACVANTCSCNFGVASSGAKCATDGANMCDSCTAGYTLSQDDTACDGMERARAGPAPCVRDRDRAVGQCIPHMYV